MSVLQIRFFNGRREPFPAGTQVTINILNGRNERVVYDSFSTPDVSFAFPFADNPIFDRYSVTAFAKGYRQAGFAPVQVLEQGVTTLDLMLAPDEPTFSFADARFEAVSAAFPFMAGDVSAADAEARYDRLIESSEATVACLLNLGEAMRGILLADGTPLKYLRRMRWDKPPQQDRFFAYCDAALVDQVRNAAAKGLFAPETSAALFHPGATNSWKQVQFGEANVQLTFHENPPDCCVVDGVPCVTVEPDIDYYRDLGAHAIFEVVRNDLTHTLTNPVEVYVLRWMAGRRAGVPDFNPMYTLS